MRQKRQVKDILDILEVTPRFVLNMSETTWARER